MWFDSNHDKLCVDQTFVFEILNGYEGTDRNILFKLKEDTKTRGYESAFVMEQFRLDMRKYSLSGRTKTEWNKSYITTVLLVAV